MTKALLLAILAISLGASQGRAQSLAAASELASVWNLAAQPCNGGGGNMMSRHPQQDAIRQAKVIPLADLGLEFRVPQLPGFSQTAVKLFLKDKSRGVVDHYVLLARADLEAPEAAVVITELPQNLRNHKGAFSAVQAMQGRSAWAVGLRVEPTALQGPHGEALEYIVKNRVGSHCFPTADFKLAGAGQARSIGISRFVLMQDRLVEFALILPVPPGMQDEEAEGLARKTMDGYWQHLKAAQ